jgi:hypothetical protein
VGQPFVVDLSLELGLSRAGQTDDLNHTVSARSWLLLHKLGNCCRCIDVGMCTLHGMSCIL